MEVARLRTVEDTDVFNGRPPLFMVLAILMASLATSASKPLELVGEPSVKEHNDLLGVF